MPLLIRSRSRSDSCWYSGAGAPGVRPERRGCVVWSVSVISSTRSRWSNRCATAGSPSCLYRDARHSAAFRSLETSGAAAVRFSRRGDACCSSEQRAGEGHQRPLRTGTRCAQQAAERTKAPAPWRSGAFAASCTRGSGPLVGRASRVPRPTRRPAPTERSVIREHVPPDADGDDRDDQAERKPELTAGQPATEGRTELGARHRADRHDERGFVRNLVGDELPHDAHARGERRDGERAADRHANRHTDDDQQQRDEQERAAGADQSRADADASSTCTIVTPATAFTLSLPTSTSGGTYSSNGIMMMAPPTPRSPATKAPPRPRPISVAANASVMSRAPAVTAGEAA